DAMCHYYNPNECGHPDFPSPGYTPSCKRKCLDGNGQEQEEDYASGTFCFVTYSSSDDALYYLGYCDRGVCLPENRDADGRPPRQWDGVYHVCDDRRSDTTVKNCTYICMKQTEKYLPREYYYGIYRNSSCK
ncbi:hypothetical protein HPB47_002025, partial [Ixodes persulcatus]